MDENAQGIREDLAGTQARVRAGAGGGVEMTQLLDVEKGVIVSIETGNSGWNYTFIEDDMGWTNRLDHVDGRMILCNWKDFRALGPILGIEIREEENKE
jgi:hypothetical protein